VRCRRKGHVLAELTVIGDGHRVLRMRHHAVLHIAANGEVSQQPGSSWPGLWHLSDWETRNSAASCPVACACRRVHLVSVADIEAAVAAGKPSVVAAPVRPGQRSLSCTMPVVTGEQPIWLLELARFGSMP
jgi:hypothetical protein